MSESIWTATQKMPEFPALEGTRKTDVLVIGGGLCGILCAYFLDLAGISYILVEADRVGRGVTQNTTAKITSLHGLIYEQLLKSEGREKAALYLRANQIALDKYKELAQKIDCDFEEKNSYIYSLSDRKKLEDEVRAVNSLGFPAEFTEHTSLPFQTKGAVMFPNQAQFHPLKFLSKTAENLNIYEHTFIRDISENTAVGDRCKIKADKIIVTTHFPFINRHGSYFLKMYQHRSYVLALEHAFDVKGMYMDEASTGLSFRNYKDLLIVGGGAHRTGKKGGNWQDLKKFAEKYCPDAEEKYHWAAQDCISLDHIPYIGHYSKRTPNLYTATGFNKWGITSSMVSAILLTDLIAGTENEWSDVFSPSRSMLKPQLLYNGLEAAGNLLTPTRRRCPHMGCALKWNPQEHTWDCPCHGSRFEKDGTLINNPAKRGANVE